MSTARAAAVAAFCLALITGCGGQSVEPRSPGSGHHASASPEAPSASAPPDSGPHGRPTPPTAGGSEPFVYNLYRGERGREDREPEGLTASEFTTFTGLEWASWSADAATASGEVRGTWCLPDCQENPYQVTVVLSEPRTVHGTVFFTRYEVTDAPGMPDHQLELLEQVDGGRLMLPADEAEPSAATS
ncbi:hypothetical protein [Marinactinospora rubrisoli]|uniref:Lipoprotein n=1 Tax=Marinactinospora rubrisoli TaxID=2715399 RepID=A0ABW2KIU3_9ACTN